MKGLFIPEITTEMFRNGCLESIEALMAEGEIYDIDYPLEQKTVLDKIRAEIDPKCDRINSLASALPYTAHREIQELLCEIMDLCKPESEGEE